MGLFSKKKMTEAEWCEDYYDRQMFGDEGEDRWNSYADGLYLKLTEINSGMTDVDRDFFRDEYCALCLEVVGLTWQLYKREFIAYNQSEVTKIYTPYSLWQKMVPYNESIKIAVDLFHIDKMDYVNRKRVEARRSVPMYDFEYMDRILNRVEAYKPWFKRLPHICLTTAFFRELGVEENNPACDLMHRMIHYFAGSVGKEIRSIKIV